MSDAAAEIEAGLRALGERFREAFARAATEQELRNAKAEVLGKNGELTKLLKLMGKVPAEQKKSIGEQVNAVKDGVEKAFDERLRALLRAARDADLAARPFDLTLPGRVPAPRGHLHPITRVKDEILDIFRSLGFEVSWGPEVDLEANNFEKLAFPPDHPATDMQDSFWVNVEGGRPDARVLLRTHTSTVQVRTQDVLPDSLGPVLIPLLKSVSRELAAGALVVADRRKNRVRVLPLKRLKD